MYEVPALRKAPPQALSSGSIHTLMTSRQPYMSEPIASKRVCFYKSGDTQFSGLPVVINNRTFKTFEGLLDSLSKRVPLPFGVRTITTPHGHTTVRSLDQLQNGHSYICSDKRTVKPIDLERARRKPPPWYNARPVSNRRLAKKHQSPGPRSTRRARRNEHAALLHTPKRLVVFRNGDPEVKHTLLLQKRTTHSFEALLGLVSEVMRFPVLKLHTPDGRRVDGLPALILCSGVLVAAGREPFKKGNYDVQKPSAPTWLPAKSVGRPHPVSRKKKPMTSSTRSRPFSPYSERYIVNQIHSFAGSAYDYPSNPTGSVEMDTGQVLESVAETVACLDGDGEGNLNIPTEDDIEKSFRVNQDGSMTVEMKVRLTIKEEETIHWTTTLSRSSVANHMKSELHPDLGVNISDNILPNVVPVVSDDIQNCPKDHAFSKESSDELQACSTEDFMKVKGSFHSLPSTPGWLKVQQKQCIGSSVKVTETEIQENMLGSYAYSEETNNGEMKQEQCMIQQCRSRPVPKPRINLPVEHTVTSHLQSNTYKSAEILQLQDNGEEVHETVLHIYKRESCQENLLTNTPLCIQDMGSNSSVSGRPPSADTILPASSENTVQSSTEDLESEPRASGTCQKNKSQEISAKMSKMLTPVTEVCNAVNTSKRRKPVRVIVKKNHIFQIPTEQKRKDNTTNMFKEMKKMRADSFSQAGTLRHTEHYRAKAVHKLLKRRNNRSNHERIIPSTLHNPVQLTVEDPNEISAEKDQCTNKMNPDHTDLYCKDLNASSPTVKKDLLCASTNKCILTRQTSMHEERYFQRETRELSESISLPALHSSSSVFNEYVELWLQKSEPHHEQETSTHSELQEKPTFLTPLEVELCLETSEITCETMGATDKSKEDLPYYVSEDSSSSPRKLSSAKTSMDIITSTKETLPNNATLESTSSPRDSSKENKSLSKRNIKLDITSRLQKGAKLHQKSTARQIPLPVNVYNQSISSEDSVLPNDNLSKTKKLQNDSQGETLQVKNNHVTSDTNSTSSESSQDLANQELSKFPKNMKMSSESKDSSLETSTHTYLRKTSSDNDHVKQMPIPKMTSSEKTLLPNQSSVEKIPKNNTLSKASLFDSRPGEETALSSKVTSEKKPRPQHSSQIKIAESKRALLSKSQVNNDTTKTGEIEIFPHADTEHAKVKSPAGKTVSQAEKSYTVKMAVRPDMRPVLEELCHSIQSLRKVTQQKRRSCLEKSNSMPDFSSHLGSTFGSSSRVLLAFLSVMTLKDSLVNLNTCCQAQDNLSCSEALLMLQSLKAMAAMEDTERLRSSLNALQNSTSTQLLQSWKGFQELSKMSRSQSVTQGFSSSGSCSEEEAIQGLMEDLGVPERVREELAALCSQEVDSSSENQVEGVDAVKESLPEVKMNGFRESREKTISFPDSGLEEDVNLYVKSVIEQAVKAHSGDCYSSDAPETHLLAIAGKDIKVASNWHVKEFAPKRQTGCVLDHDVCNDMCIQEQILEEDQQGMGERGAVPWRQQEIDVKAQSTVNKNEQKSKCGANTADIMEENPKQHMILYCDEGKEIVENEVDTKEHSEDGITENDPKLSDSPSSSGDKMNIFEEDKYSSGEEEDSCEEELMSLSEDQANDKKENLLNVEDGIEEIHDENTMNSSLFQTQSQLLSKTDCVEEHTEEPEIVMAQQDIEHKQVICEERNIFSEVEQVVLEEPECYTIYQEHFVEEMENEEEEENVENEEKGKQNSVAELISTLQSVTQRIGNKPKKPVKKLFKVPDNSDTDLSNVSSDQDRVEKCMNCPFKVQSQDKGDLQQVSKESLKTIRTTKQSHMDLTSEPLSSSLAFSYDSRSSSLAQEPEGSIQGNRVKSIREMFLAKSNTRTQNGQRRLHSPNSDMSDYQTESTDDSGGIQSQTSPETSSGEDDASRLTIAKGFVRRTIERLYGRGHSNSTGPDDKRPLSASKEKKREVPGRANVTSLASFHEAQRLVRTDLSYFNATSSSDVINEPKLCISLNTHIGPGDADLIDKGPWLLCENQPINESSTKLQETQGDVEKKAGSEQNDLKEDAPYSLFCPASPRSVIPSAELEELSGPSEQKFTYFNLPNASDSELEPEGRNAYTPPKTEATMTPITQLPKSWAEKNSFLPAFNPPAIKRTDNKVHPLLALTPPVVIQPTRGQGAKTDVSRRSTEPDVLEMLFLFCGQHCPIL